MRMEQNAETTKPTGLLNIGNATGSNRTKVALKPGYSLVNWVRFTNSNENLNGSHGKQAVVTIEELKNHDKLNDCWTCIRGKVYNITAYLDYHPGGADELMKGAGKDSTKMFDDIHSYVNYESLLQKCCVGRMVNHDLW